MKTFLNIWQPFLQQLHKITKFYDVAKFDYTLLILPFLNTKIGTFDKYHNIDSQKFVKIIVRRMWPK